MIKKWLMRALLALLPLVALEAALRAAGIGGSIVYEEHPDYGYRPRPNQRFSTLGHPIQILENGFRAPRGIERLLVVGDSVAYGTATLRDEETFAALLGADNAGVNGWGPENVARFLDHVACESYRAVIWVFPSCDTLRPFMRLRGGLISTTRPMWLRMEYLFRFFWYGWFRPGVTPSDPATAEDNLRAVLDAHARLAERHCRLLMVFVPAREECEGGETADTPHFRRLIERVAAAGVPVVIPRPEADCARYFRDTAHLTPEGNRWLARQISADLASRGW
jgi:hypothetical protein